MKVKKFNDFLLENSIKDKSVFGHEYDVLLDMIKNEVDNPKKELNYKIKKLTRIQQKKAVTLYRVVFVKDPNKIDSTKLGHHYVYDISDFHEEMLDYLYNNASKENNDIDEYDAYLVEIETPASNIDYYETMRTFALHPLENEITISDDTNIVVKSIIPYYE